MIAHLLFTCKCNFRRGRGSSVINNLRFLGLVLRVLVPKASQIASVHCHQMDFGEWLYLHSSASRRCSFPVRVVLSSLRLSQSCCKDAHRCCSVAHSTRIKRSKTHLFRHTRICFATRHLFHMRKLSWHPTQTRYPHNVNTTNKRLFTSFGKMYLIYTKISCLFWLTYTLSVSNCARFNGWMNGNRWMHRLIVHQLWLSFVLWLRPELSTQQISIHLSTSKWNGINLISSSSKNTCNVFSEKENSIVILYSLNMK